MLTTAERRELLIRLYSMRFRRRLRTRRRRAARVLAMGWHRR